jgi:hypothetical protein
MIELIINLDLTIILLSLIAVFIPKTKKKKK